MRIALVVDNAFRDLQNLVLLGYELMTRGHEVTFIPINYQYQCFFKKKYDVAVLTFHRYSNKDIITKLHNVGAHVIVMDTEGGIFISLDHMEKIFVKDDPTNLMVSKYFVWGKRLFDFFEKKKYYPEGVSELIGSMKTDFYHSSFASVTKDLFTEALSDDLSSVLAKSGGKYVLINANFPLINGIAQTKEQKYQVYKKDLQYEDNYLNEWFSDTEKRFELMVSLTKELATEFNDLIFVFRPHPFEKLETYEELFKALDNVKVVREGQVDHWIANSMLVIQKSCSTGIEAVMNDKPSLSPGWMSSKFHFKDVEQMSHQIDSVTDFKLIIPEILKGFYKSNVAESVVDDVITGCYYKVDGKRYKALASSIEGLVPKNKSIVSRWKYNVIGGETIAPDSLGFFLRMKMYGYRMRKRLRMKFSDEWLGGEYKRFGKGDVDRIMRNLKKNIGTEQLEGYEVRQRDRVVTLKRK